ncbi:hypothetical protein [Acetobacter estunensis]|uniref:hypothetical protein n=1 Tax=Acetobacter estunensis TaxID=104097 RepID=UPI001C2DAA39|nr:hypothetical protein [Acetobacter estunensis]MBV1837115.1 hypothetical protein [Acetobacter estunensis]
MSRFIGDNDAPNHAGEGKHGQARAMTEAALRAEERGEQAEADRLFVQAENTDPEAVANVLEENRDQPSRFHIRAPRSTDFGDDAAVAAITRTIEPNSDAPDRAGITDNGSGADSERR